MIIDAHQDIAFARYALDRDFSLSAHQKRAAELARNPEQSSNICTVGLPDMLAGGIGLVIGSLYMAPARTAGAHTAYCFETPHQASRQALQEIGYYDALCRDASILPVRTRSELDLLLAARTSRPLVGLMIEMEGTDAIIEPGDVHDWARRGVRQIGLAWATANRYCGGNREPGPLTPEGAQLLHEMDAAGLILDVSHLAEESFWQALDVFHGPLVASHTGCRALVPGERQLSDDMIRAVAERDGMFGVVIYNRFLKSGWTPEQGKEAVTLADVVRHIDHIVAIAGDADNVGIGSDLDGGYGQEATPAEIDTIADLALLGPALAGAGYPTSAIDAILSGNWLRFLSQALPQS
jgi:membrane dipeptidase